MWFNSTTAGIYPKSMRSVCQKDMYTPTFIAVLLTIPKKWEQSKCLSIGEWIIKINKNIIPICNEILLGH